MACYKVIQKVLGYPIEAVAVQSGNDWNVSVYGGCSPHIGSMSIAWFDKQEVYMKTIQRPNHKEAVISESYAEFIAREYKCCVTVSCGIHYDNPSKSDLQTIIESSLNILHKLKNKMGN